MNTAVRRGTAHVRSIKGIWYVLLKLIPQVL